MSIPPAGLTPAGFFVPQLFASPTDPPGILADAIDPQTGEYLSISRGIDPIDSQVLTALTLVRGSGAATQDDGQDFLAIKKVDETTATLIEAETRRALGRLVVSGDIKIKRVYPNADPDTDIGTVAVDYVNSRAVDTQRRLATVQP